MNNLDLALSLGYPCIFKPDHKEAANHLYGLMSNKISGYDQGSEYWIKCINQLLDSKYDFIESNELLSLKRPQKYWKKVLIDLKNQLKQKPSAT